MKGFFDKVYLQQTPYRSEKGILSCVSCGLYKSATTPKMEPYGKFGKGIMVIGDGPGEDDDRKGRPWQGKTGRVLQQKFRQLGVDLFEDCISLNAVNCRLVDKKGSNRAPTEYEIACCRRKVVSAIKVHKPRVIILLGGAAISSLITGYRWRGSQSGVSTWRGWAIPDREFRAWVCPTFHPSFIELQEEQNEADVIWENDLRQAFAKVEESFPQCEPEENCVVISEDIESVLRQFNQEGTTLAFDIEATGIKPYNKQDHQIVSISFCNNLDKACAIPFPTKRKHIQILKSLLENPNIHKVAANLKYEDNWLVTLHDIHTQSWIFDTMQAAHILDNRPSISSLKFQAYVRFGLPAWDTEVGSYLKSSDANTPNRIMELTWDRDSFRKLLLYNGIDSLMEYRLAMVQMREMGVRE